MVAAHTERDAAAGLRYQDALRLADGSGAEPQSPDVSGLVRDCESI
jgi:hypothetical protein